ncbi:MAG: hypothetical protein A2W90_18345 [Bacteroidetes bacterium GWF2_42_66]|nr:MAG: hypothetical protein A2W92_11570 [Bacteroidetes bacterium GWA2_42_15]OFX98211.1 MAG: hypothetical protein A2W89_09835 [Bacteroidetes bacterium GWE2_42_39]OFY42596.1 MAG: hypothetical protein A2W90_18345 [Bacteroidetes bacterium GWF2_42_66]HAZ03035.1 hypothetical protein [Marinilabiliales bacterium]HBL74315.1 hypothetical protein [Prolixibacteraceae bacterium]
MLLIMRKKYNNKQIEDWATIAVKDCLSMTDTLSQYIKENDKTPSWDGDVLIYKSNSTDKKDIIGKITVQVKGKMADNIKREECTFSVDTADLVNYKNDGGTIYFVVLINKNDPSKKRVFYDTLTPLKIDKYIKDHKNQDSRVINLKRLPGDKYAIQTIFYNFNQDSKKQHSFSNISPIELGTLSSGNGIVEITSSLTIFSPDKKHPSPIQAFLNNDVYWYAKIANSPILHPVELCSIISVVSKDGFSPIFVNGDRYENYVSENITKDDITIRFGESTTMVFTGKSKGARMDYKPSGILRSRIKDINFIISIIETGVIVYGENKKVNLGQMVADTPFDIDSAKKELESYRRIEQFWRSLHVVADFDIGNIDSNSSLEELYLLMKSINGKQPIRVNVDGEHSSYLFHKSISNFKILFILDAVDKEKSIYKIYNFFDYKKIIKITRGDTEHISSQYSVLSPDDYMELSNIDFSKMLQSYKDLISLNNNIFEPANYDLLNLLLAYDKHNDHPDEILKTAKEIACWLLDESADNLYAEIKTINYLQTIKRERELTSEENRKLYEIAENENSSLMFKLGANLLLENYKVARIQFEQLCEQDKEAFRSFPIYKFWK